MTLSRKRLSRSATRGTSSLGVYVSVEQSRHEPSSDVVLLLDFPPRGLPPAAAPSSSSPPARGCDLRWTPGWLVLLASVVHGQRQRHGRATQPGHEHLLLRPGVCRHPRTPSSRPQGDACYMCGTCCHQGTIRVWDGLSSLVASCAIFVQFLCNFSRDTNRSGRKQRNFVLSSCLHYHLYPLPQFSKLMIYYNTSWGSASTYGTFFPLMCDDAMNSQHHLCRTRLLPSFPCRRCVAAFLA